MWAHFHELSAFWTLSLFFAASSAVNTIQNIPFSNVGTETFSAYFSTWYPALPSFTWITVCQFHRRATNRSTLWLTPETLSCCHLRHHMGFLVSDSASSILADLVNNLAYFLLLTIPFWISSASAVVLPYRKTWAQSRFAQHIRAYAL
jgi:hypothetical protein